MKDNARKITKIMDELVYYLLRYECEDIRVKIRKEMPFYQMVITATFQEEYRDKILNIEKMLERGSRDKSIEAEFWELMGLNSASFDSELQLIGMMVDQSVIEIEENFFRIEICKNM